MSLNIRTIYSNWYDQNDGDFSKLDELLKTLQIDRFELYNLFEAEDMISDAENIKLFYGDSFVIMELLSEGGGCKFIHNIYNGTYQFPGKTSHSLNEILEYQNYTYVRLHPQKINDNYKEFFFHAVNHAVTQLGRSDSNFRNEFEPFDWENELNATYNRAENKFYK